MEKQILHQRFEYAEIKPFMNYSNIIHKPKNLGLNTFDILDTIEDEDDIFGKKFNLKLTKTKNKVTINLMSESECKRKHTKYFYSGEEVGFRLPLKPYFKDCVFLTDKDRHIKNHFGRPFSSIILHIYERTIYLKDNKLTVKLNHYQKGRYFNCKYFKKNFICHGFSLDLNKGYLTTFERTSKKRSRVRRNSIGELRNLPSSVTFFHDKILDITSYIKNHDRSSDKEYIREKMKKEFDDVQFMESLYQVFSIISDSKISPPTINNPSHNKEWMINKVVDIFVKTNKIKVPNDYHELIEFWYPTKAYLKKNDNKLVASILDRLKIKSKHTIKLIHENPKMSITRLYSFVKYFGYQEFHKYLSNLNHNLYTYPLSEGKSNITSLSRFPYEMVVYDLYDNEKHNILKLLNDFLNENEFQLINPISFDNILSSLLRQIDDHIRMLNRIREHHDDIKFNSQTIRDFNEEHIQFSRRENLIRRGYYIEFIFEDELLNTIEEPIKTENGTYYPVILKKDVEYTLEGQHMHHCVGGYYENENSIIISIRQSSIDGPERITCEYSTYNKRCVQAKYFCNTNPPERFSEPLSIVTNRVLEYNKEFKSKEKIKTSIKREVLEQGEVVQPNNMVEFLF
jgi:hypothetical protein